MSDDDFAWRVEAACRNACPSPREIVLQDTWLARLAGGAVRRANSINPLRADAYDPSRVIGPGRRLFHAHGRPLVFRVPSIARGLDARLDEAGFTIDGRNLTLVSRPLRTAVGAGGVEIAPEPSAAWLAAKFAMTPEVGAKPDVYRSMMKAIVLPKAFVTLVDDGAIVAVAYGAIHEEILVIEAVVTDAGARRRGHGRRLVGGLLNWARSLGATAACLQVGAGNLAAIALYRALGFETDLYDYRYFTEPSACPTRSGP